MGSASSAEGGGGALSSGTSWDRSSTASMSMSMSGSWGGMGPYSRANHFGGLPLNRESPARTPSFATGNSSDGTRYVENAEYRYITFDANPQLTI